MLLHETILLPKTGGSDLGLYRPNDKLSVLLNKNGNMKNLVERPAFKAQYDNFIGGKFVPPVKGVYFDNISPIDGKVFTKAARSSKEDVELALDAAHEAFKTWSKSSAAYRSNI